MNRPILLSLLFLPLFAQAQTYFYVNTISVTPPAPMTSDVISIALDGDLATTGTYVMSTSWNLVGHTVNITVNCGQNIGLDVLVPHMENFNIGMLEAGDYTIVLDGTGMGDFASVPEHHFSVAGGGGGACDSLIIDYVRWAPFSTTELEVHVHNNSSTLFDYPGFVLLDQNNDTLAKETVSYFGIAPESWHTLTIQSGAVIPEGWFSGTLFLWTNFYAQLACTYPMSIDLCPDVCVNLFPYITSFGITIPATDFTWSILDNMGNPAGSGTLHLDQVPQTDHDTVCLLPGNYSLYMNTSGVPGGELHYGFYSSPINNGDHQDTFVQGGEPNIISIGFYTPCIGLPQGIAPIRRDAALSVVMRDDALDVSRADRLALGEIRIIDASGRIVLATRVDNPNAIIPLGGMADGIYTVLAHGNRPMSARVAILR